MNYNYQALQKLYKDSARKVKSKTADGYTAQIGIAAGYALDMIDTARADKTILNLTLETEDNVQTAIIPLHLRNTRHGITAEMSRDDIAKKLGAYELFTIYNMVAEAGNHIQVGYVLGNLLLQVKKEDGTVLQFDPQREIIKVLKSFIFSEPGEEFMVFGTLQPFYQDFTEKFLAKL